MQQLSDQEIVRREALQKIRDLGINPFPAEQFKVSFKTTDFETADFVKQLEKELTNIKGIGTEKAVKLSEALRGNRFNASKILGNEELASEIGIGEILEFNDGTPSQSFEDFANGIRAKALGDYDVSQLSEVTIAGRFMGQRGPFAKLQDAYGRVQLYINKKELGDNEEELKRNQALLKLLHIGDFIGIKGFIFSTGMGEVSIHVKELTFLSKALKSLPVVKTDKDGKVHDAFTDPELRYRQRYVDLVVNPQVKDIFLKRTKIIQSMRNYFNEHDWLEVETPVLQPIHGGAAARPFATHHNSLDMPLYMRIANELYLKRLIVGGFDGVYEFGKMFRNEGMDRTHNPEFTSMEIYVAYKDYIWMMGMVEECLERVTREVTGGTEVQVGENTINFAGPYRRLSMEDSIEEYTGVDIKGMDEAALRDVCKTMHIPTDKTMGKGKLIDEIFGEKVEALLIQPTYITDYPIEMTPLAKKHRTKEGLVERFELFVNGKEIANAYTELNDPIDQRERFEDQLKLAARGDDEAMVLDEDFLRALEYGMPPTSGLGIGIDRLTMMLTNNTSIQEVLFFPQMKAENQATEEE